MISFTAIRLALFLVVVVGHFGTSISVPKSKFTTRIGPIQRQFDWRIENAQFYALRYHLLLQKDISTPSFELGDSKNTTCELRLKYYNATSFSFKFGVTAGGPLEDVYYRLSIVRQLLLNESNAEENDYTPHMKDLFYGKEWPNSVISDSNLGFRVNGVRIVRLEISFSDGIRESDEGPTSYLQVSRLYTEPVSRIEHLPMETPSTRYNLFGTSISIPVSKYETRIDTIQRQYEWRIEIAPGFNLTQYILEKNDIFSPSFELGDSKNSTCVLRLKYNSATSFLYEFGLTKGGPLKKVYYRLSTVRRLLLKRSNAEYNDYASKIAPDEFMGSGGKFAFGVISEIGHGYNLNGVMIFKLELSFDDGIRESHERPDKRFHEIESDLDDVVPRRNH